MTYLRNQNVLKVFYGICIFHSTIAVSGQSLDIYTFLNSDYESSFDYQFLIDKFDGALLDAEYSPNLSFNLVAPNLSYMSKQVTQADGAEVFRKTRTSSYNFGSVFSKKLRATNGNLLLSTRINALENRYSFTNTRISSYSLDHFNFDYSQPLFHKRQNKKYQEFRLITQKQSEGNLNYFNSQERQQKIKDFFKLLRVQTSFKGDSIKASIYEEIVRRNKELFKERRIDELYLTQSQLDYARSEIKSKSSKEIKTLETSWFAAKYNLSLSSALTFGIPAIHKINLEGQLMSNCMAHISGLYEKQRSYLQFDLIKSKSLYGISSSINFGLGYNKISSEMEEIWSKPDFNYLFYTNIAYRIPSKYDKMNVSLSKMKLEQFELETSNKLNEAQKDLIVKSVVLSQLYEEIQLNALEQSLYDKRITNELTKIQLQQSTYDAFNLVIANKTNSMNAYVNNLERYFMEALQLEEACNCMLINEP